MTIDFRPDGGSGRPQAAGLKPVDPQVAATTLEIHTSAAPDGGDEAIPGEPNLPGDAAGIAPHGTATIGINALKGMADALHGKTPPTRTPEAQKLQGDADALLSLAVPLQTQDPDVWQAMAGMRTLLQQRFGAVNLDQPETRVELFGQAQLALKAVRKALAATPPPPPATVATLQALERALGDLQHGLSLKPRHNPAALIAGSGLYRNANEAKADLEAMTALNGADGRTLSQKLAGGDERAKAILQHAGYSVATDGTVSDASGKVLSADEVETLGRSLLQEAAADYQRHKTSYLSLRSQLEGQLDKISRTVLDDLEASMHRLESGAKGTKALDSVMDGMMLHLARGGKAAAIDIGFIAQVSTAGVEEASLTPPQRTLLDDIVSRGGIIKRENGRIYLTGISPADLQAIRNAYQLLTNPTSDAARQISQALIDMVQSWGRAQAISRATGLSLQQALASRSVSVGQKPPQPAAAPEAPHAGGVQSGTAPTVGPTVTTVAAGDEERGDVAAGADPAKAADPTEAVQLTHLKQVYDEREKEDHQHTDDKRRVALDHLTALRLDADAKAADERAARHVKEGPSV